MGKKAGKPALVFCGFADIFLFKTLLTDDQFKAYDDQMEDYPSMRVPLDWWKLRKSRYHTIINSK